MSQRYVRLEAAPPLGPEYDRPWYCEPYRCDGCARQFGLQGPAHTRLICYRFDIETIYKLCPECVESLHEVGPSSEEGTADQERQEVVLLTSEDIETLLRGLEVESWGLGDFYGEAIPKETEERAAKIRHAYKSLTGQNL